jgi:hypothetical protein
MSYAGPGRFEDRDAAYYSSSERAAFDPDPARLVVDAETVMLEPVSVPSRR